MAAKAHGSAVLPAAAGAVRAAAPAGSPQRWQNFAPGVRVARHSAHAAPSTGVPHCAQKRPSTAAAQVGQVAGREEGCVMREKLTTKS